jgi:transglycosylase-like protein with SLT domain/LysM domain-containing protein
MRLQFARPGRDTSLPPGPTDHPPTSGPRSSRGWARSFPAIVLSLGLLVGAGAAGFATHTYVVQPGDSLWAISRANGLTVSQLAAANGMSENDLLLIGRNLQIPSNDPQAAAPSQSAPTASSTSGATTGNSWTFCSTFSAPGGPWGVLPDLLQQSPDRLSLQPLFMKWASYYNLSLPLLEAIAWQESGWQQGVVSSAGAVGTGQLMPDTASFISGTLVGMPLNINSVSDNIRMSAAFLAYLAGVEGNNRCSTIAAYYEGPLNLSQYGVFPETETYVASVEALIPRFQ